MRRDRADGGAEFALQRGLRSGWVALQFARLRWAPSFAGLICPAMSGRPVVDVAMEY
jgi:hypothetical protein